MKRGRVASFTEVARIVAATKRDLLRHARGQGRNHNYTGTPSTEEAVLRNQPFLRRLATESTKRLRAAGIHIEGTR